MEITISMPGGGFVMISNGTPEGTMRYMYYSVRDALRLYREKFALQGQRLTIIRNY